MKKTIRFETKEDLKLLREIEALAKKERRTFSQMARFLLSDGLAER